MQAHSSSHSLKDLRQICFFPSGSVSPLEQLGPGPFQPLDSPILSADPLLFPGSESHWSRPGSGSAGKQPPTCCTGAAGQSGEGFLMQAGAQAKAGRFVVVCGARPFPRCHCLGKAIIPPRDKQGCLWLSLLTPEGLEPLTAGQPGSALGNCHLPQHSQLHSSVRVGGRGGTALGRGVLEPRSTGEIKASRPRGEGKGSQDTLSY